VKELDDVLRSLLAPESPEMVFRWAEKSIILTAAETDVAQGGYSADMTPYVRKILEFFRKPESKVLVIMAGTQVVKTMALMLGVAWFVSHRSGRVLWVLDSLGNARSFSKTRWKILVENSPGLAPLIPADKDNFQHMEQFLGSTIINFTGSNSAGNLSQRGADLVILDEVDKHPDATEEEGDAVKQAEQRKKARDKSKLVATSSPTTTAGKIWQLFKMGTMEEWFVPCPECGKGFVLDTGNEDCARGKLVWDPQAKRADGSWDWDLVQESARMECPHCGHGLDEGEKVEAVAQGDFVVMNKNALPGWESYHVASHNSAWADCRLRSLAVKFLQYKAEFDLRSWDKYYRGWPSQDKVAKPKVEDLKARREHWDGVPDRVRCFTFGVDTQDDRLELQLVGWGDGLERWAQDYAVFHGNPANVSVWNELLMYLGDLCKRVRVTAGGIDTGGHFTDEAYAFVQRAQRMRLPVYAFKGASRSGAPVLARGSKIKTYGIRLYMIGTDTAKEVVYNQLAVLEKGPGYCHFHDSLDDAYFEGLVSEEIKLSWKHGQQRREWVCPAGTRNEPLDTAVYALAALHLRGLREVTRTFGQQELELGSGDEAKGEGEKAGAAVVGRRKMVRRVRA
jgi:phage terminase large subunit GpA-like protein